MHLTIRIPLCAALLCVALGAPVALQAYRIDTVADGLDHPWSVAFLPDGALLVTERVGQLRRIDPDGRVGEPVTGVPAVYFAGQGGLFDVLPHPQFGSNGLIYLSYASGNRRANATTLARARLAGNALEGLEVIFAVAPEKSLPQHYGGRLAFLPDGTLLLTTGEGFDYREQAQNTRSLLGKTVRLNDDGSIPADNPFADGVKGHPAIATYGHRNPQGLAVDPARGTIYLHEHGPRGGDEINILVPGRNYGWPAVTFGIDYNGAYVSPLTGYPGMEPPVKVWVPSIAPSGLAVYYGAEFPEWSGSLLVGALVDREVRRVTLAADGTSTEEALFSELGARIRDVRVAADGRVYLVTDGNPGQVLRVSAD